MHIAKCLLGIGCCALSGAALAGSGFCSSAPLTIADNTTATPYPSAISVTGGPGSITSVIVQLAGFSHPFPDDVGIVLVGPTGLALRLQGGAGDANSAVSGLTYTFDDAATNTLPDLAGWTAGSYKPTTYYGAENFPAPGPGTTYGNPGPFNAGTATFANTYAGTTSNGTWNLYVVDFASGDAGSLSQWCISFTGTPVMLQRFSVD
jgi:hypothetical protein